MQTLHLGVVISDSALLWGIYSPGATALMAQGRYPFERMAGITREGPNFIPLAKLFSEIPLSSNTYNKLPAKATSNDLIKQAIDTILNEIMKKYDGRFAKITVGASLYYSERTRYFWRSIFREYSPEVNLLNEDYAVASSYNKPKKTNSTICYSLRHHAIEISLFSYKAEKLKPLYNKVLENCGVNRFDLLLATHASHYRNPPQLEIDDLRRFNRDSTGERKKLFALLSEPDKKQFENTYNAILQPSLDDARARMEEAGENPQILFLSEIEDASYFENRLQMALGVEITRVPSTRILSALCGTRDEERQADTTGSPVSQKSFPAASELTKKQQGPNRRPIENQNPIREIREAFSQISKLTQSLPPESLEQITEEGIERAIRWAADLYIGQNRIEEAYELYKRILPKDKKNMPGNNMPILRDVAATLCLNQARKEAKRKGDRKEIKRWLNYANHFGSQNPEIQSGLARVSAYLNSGKTGNVNNKKKR